MSAIAVGCSVPSQAESLDHARASLRMMVDAGLDHVVIGDHVSFQGGRGMDGLILAALYAALEPRLACYLSVYLLPLRRRRCRGDRGGRRDPPPAELRGFWHHLGERD